MMEERTQAAIEGFFSRYRDAFKHGAQAIAAFYSEPCVTARAGKVRVNATLAETRALFETVDQQYRSRGMTHGEIERMEIRSMGVNAVMATIRWKYKDASGRTLWETTFSYNVYRRNDDWKILVQTMHDE
ncbi:MAG TPA: hypothetical protein VEB41_10880 [Burkholderiales bacterium]|nr:hypothetical protein [Burkholderiales bacterium]